MRIRRSTALNQAPKHTLRKLLGATGRPLYYGIAAGSLLILFGCCIFWWTRQLRDTTLDEFSLRALATTTAKKQQQQQQRQQSSWPPLDRVKAIAGRENTIILITVNCENVDFADNLINSIQGFGVDSFVLVPLDQKASTILEQLYPHNTLPQSPGLTGIRASNSSYGSSSFKKLSHARPRMIRAFLELGVHVLYNDADMVWKSNVLQDLKSRGGASWFKALDAVLVDDSAKNTSKVCNAKTNYLCTCNMWFKATPPSVELMKRWEEVMEQNSRKGGDKKFQVNQFAFNAALEQTKSVRFECLSGYQGYPSGKQYFEFMDDTEKQQVKAVHNNYIVGKPNKLGRFQSHGLWKLSDQFTQTQLSCMR